MSEGLKHRKSKSQSEPAAAEPAVVLLKDEDKSKKWKSWNERFVSTWVMIFGFVFLFWMGHLPMLALVFVIQVVMFKEIVGLSLQESKERKIPFFRVLNWYWFATTLFFSYGTLARRYFDLIIPHHSFISFMLYAFGLVLFVLSLRKGFYRYQFKIFAWSQLTLLIVVAQSTVLVVNMFQGMFWFVLPAMLIISNDTWAYFFGFFFGRTPLIKISPKKTWEGFIGAAVMTLLFGFFASRFLAQYEFLVCPKKDLLSMDHPTCTPDYPFVLQQYQLPAFITPLLSALGLDWKSVSLMPVQLHGLVMALFSSMIAPFGGFFASGLKRAFKIKDFGESIPGHGGVTDRMDCQIMNGLFVFVYYWNFVSPHGLSDLVFSKFIALAAQDQLAVFQKIQEHMAASGLLEQL